MGKNGINKIILGIALLCIALLASFNESRGAFYNNESADTNQNLQKEMEQLFSQLQTSSQHDVGQWINLLPHVQLMSNLQINMDSQDKQDVQQNGYEQLIKKDDILKVISDNSNMPVRLLEASMPGSFSDRGGFQPEEARQLLASLYSIKPAMDVPVLSYHHLLRNKENRKYRNNNVAISVEMFEEHMGLLHEHGYVTLTMDELALFLDGSIEIPENSVVITFDDGYLSNFVYAYPILKEYGFNATIFTISGMITDKQEKFNADLLQFFSWEEMNQHKDVFEFAGHTHDLHYISMNTSFLKSRSINSVTKDLKKSKELLDTEYFAYPYGQYNKNIIKALQDAGYSMAFTTNPYRVEPRSDKFKVSRLCVVSKTKLDYFVKFVGIGE